MRVRKNSLTTQPPSSKGSRAGTLTISLYPEQYEFICRRAVELDLNTSAVFRLLIQVEARNRVLDEAKELCMTGRLRVTRRSIATGPATPAPVENRSGRSWFSRKCSSTIRQQRKDLTRV